MSDLMVKRADNGDDIMEKIKRAAAKFIFWAAYPILRIIYPISIHWEDKKETREALKNHCIVFSNHTGYVEGLFMTRLLHKYRVWTFVGKDWYDKKKINWLFRNLPYISIDRKGGMDTEWMDKATALMQQGASFYMLPEGHTSPIGEMDVFKPGFLVLAKQSGATLVPMYITKKIKPFSLSRIVIGKPLYPDLNEKGRPSQIMKKHAESCREAVIELGVKLDAGIIK